MHQLSCESNCVSLHQVLRASSRVTVLNSFQCWQHFYNINMKIWFYINNTFCSFGEFLPLARALFHPLANKVSLYQLFYQNMGLFPWLFTRPLLWCLLFHWEYLNPSEVEIGGPWLGLCLVNLHLVFWLILARETVPLLTSNMGKKTVSVLAHSFVLLQRANSRCILSISPLRYSRS